jgi:hypothetical protein
MYIQKCHNETTYTTTKILFTKMNDTSCPEWVAMRGRGHKERVEEDEYGRSSLHSCMKKEQWNLLKFFCEGKWRRGMREKDGGGESN